MRTKQQILPAAGILGGLALCPIGHLAAIEPPPDTSKPPAALLREEGAEREAAAKLPYLGLSTASVPEMVADHLGIGAGSGVIVRTVCPDSPAEKAGLSVNDIILSLDGSPVADSDAFSESIRTRKVGERIELDIIRKGKAEKREVTLTERPAELNAHLAPDPFFGGVPQGQAERLREMMERNMQGFGLEAPGAFPDQRFEETFRMMREQMNRAFESEIPPMPQGEDGGIRFQQNSTIRLMDGEGSLEIKSSNGDTHVTVRDNANRIVWEGPWNSEEDKQAAPQDIRERIARVNVGSANGKGFTFRFGQPGIIDN